MDFFQLYDLPLSFHPAQDVVKKRYYALSKKFHPDFFATASADQQAEAMEMSTANNKAYNILSSSNRTLKYVLEHYGLLPEGEHYTLPQDFLMEMMDINEALMDLQFEPDQERVAQLHKDIANLEESLEGELTSLTTGFEDFQEDQQMVKLMKIKDLYFRMKYLARIKEKVG